MKANDRVEIVKINGHASFFRKYIGQIGQISEEVYDRTFKVKFDDGNAFHFFPEEIKLVKKGR